MPDVVFVHGLFGWGETRPLFGVAPPYFPTSDLRKMWTRGNLLFPNVGIASSDHDRACEVFAQLTGTRVDYGEEHANRCGHSRYKHVANLSTELTTSWSATHPIHLVGHSFGGNTVLKLCQLLAVDFWGRGTNSRWVLSVTCICSPLRGCALPYILGLDAHQTRHDRLSTEEGGPIRPFSITHLFGVVFGVLFKLQLVCPKIFKNVFHLRSDQWQESTTFASVLGTQHPFWRSKDNMVSEVTFTHRSEMLKEELRHISGTYLIAVSADRVSPFTTKGVVLRLVVVGLVLSIVKRQRWIKRVGGLAVILGFAASFVSRCAARIVESVAASIIHRCLVHPFLRLCSLFVSRAARYVSKSSEAETIPYLGTENDGLVEIASQRGLHATSAAVSPRRKRRSSGMRFVRSELSLRASSSLETLPRSQSTDDIATEGGTDIMQRGRWHVITIPHADHALGTWMCSKSLGTYARLFRCLTFCE